MLYVLAVNRLKVEGDKYNAGPVDCRLSSRLSSPGVISIEEK